MQIIFFSGTKCFVTATVLNKFLVWHKKFGPTQNILGPVKGQGIRAYCPSIYVSCAFYDVIVKLNCQRNVLSELVVEKKDGILDVTN